MKRHYNLALVLLLACLVIVPAQATLLSPGGSAIPGTTSSFGSAGSAVDTTLVTPDFPKGGGGNCLIDANGNPAITGLGTSVGASSGPSIVADTCLIQRNTGTLKLDFREVVYREAGGSLDFIYQIGVVGTPASGVTLQDLFMTPFNGVTMNVFDPTNIALLGLGTGSGANDDPTKVISGTGGSPKHVCVTGGNGCLTWLFGTGIGASGVSLTEVIQTNATKFVVDQFGFDSSDGRGADASFGFAPVPAAVPEPMSIIMLGTVLGLGAFFIRRRQNSKSDLSVS